MKNLILALACALSPIAMAAEGEKTTSQKFTGPSFEISLEEADKWLGALRNVEVAHGKDRSVPDEGGTGSIRPSN